MSSISNHFKYTSNVWLTSAVLTPCIFGLIAAIFDESIMEVPMIIVLAIPFGVLLSIPNYLIFLFSIWRINTIQVSNVEKKIIINLIAIVLTFGLFMLICHQTTSRFDNKGICLALAYSATLTFAIWFFHLQQQNPKAFLEQQQLPRIKMLEDILDDEIY